MYYLMQVTPKLIEQAQKVLAPLLPLTPLVNNPGLSERFGAEIYLKLETLQPVGSFKIRGATCKIAHLSDAEKTKGVITASAGNHAQGVAWGARRLGVAATVVMPNGASLLKVQRTKALGAEVILFGDSYDEAAEEARRIGEAKGLTFVHAFDDPWVMAGQGTIGFEMLDQEPGLDMIIGSVGGGGLMSGIAVAAKHRKPSIEIIGTQAQGASAMHEALLTNKLVQLNKVETFADGIAVKRTHASTFEVLKKHLSRILIANDEEIAEAILTILEYTRVLTEGAAAVSLAVLDQIKPEIKGKKVGIVLCGGNLDVQLLNRVLDRGLIRKHRRIRVNVLISDKPGSLARLTAAIAEVGANVIQAIHDRAGPSIRMDQTSVELTLETKGREHSESVLEVLKRSCLDVEVFT